MKRAVLFSIIITLLVTMTACGSKKSEKSEKKSDVEYVKEKGTLVVGITDFAPMDYKDKDGNWVGFDADMAKKFAKSLGVKVKFVEIDWDNKVMELKSKTIDCVWNGMTLTDEVKSAMECTKPYCNNAQVVVVPKDVADKYKDEKSLKKLNFVAEAGSAGEEVLKEKKLKYTPVKAQSDTLMEVSSGTADAAVIDSLMAAAMVGKGTSYKELTYTIGLNDEEYGVGFRKGSELAKKLDEFFADKYEDGTVEKLAKKYGVEAAIIEQ